MSDFYQNKYFDYEILNRAIQEVQNSYHFIDIGTIGTSLLGRQIPYISLGKGKKNILYIGTHHGMEWITSAILIRFVNEYAKEYTRGGNIYDISSRVLFETRKIYIIPMLNPDGVDYSIHGVNKNNPLKDQLIKMNKNNLDFTNWQANARGVDLNHNYQYGFKEYKIIEHNLGICNGAPGKFSGLYAESEPETKSLCSFVRFINPSLALSLHTQGEEIFYTSGEKSPPNALPIVKTISRLTGYKISIPTGSASFGGFTDWFIDEFNKPSFTLECGLGKNPLPYDDLDKIYSKLKRALYTIPILV